MEIIGIKKTGDKTAEIDLKIADEIKSYSFTFTDESIFTVDFPEDLRRFLRLVPATITHSLVEKIELSLKAEIKEFPFKLEIEKEILQLV